MQYIGCDNIAAAQIFRQQKLGAPRINIREGKVRDEIYTISYVELREKGRALTVLAPKNNFLSDLRAIQEVISVIECSARLLPSEYIKIIVCIRTMQFTNCSHTRCHLSFSLCIL